MFRFSSDACAQINNFNLAMWSGLQVPDKFRIGRDHISLERQDLQSCLYPTGSEETGWKIQTHCGTYQCALHQ